MTQDSKATSVTESAPRVLSDRYGEIARALDEYPSDMHDDPDAPNEPPPAGTEATEAVGQWRAAKSLLKLRSQVNAMAPSRNKDSDGTIGDSNHCSSPNSTSDHCPRIVSGGVGVVAAMDITHDPAGGCNAGQIATSIHASRDSRVKYIIWNRKIANSSPIHGQPAWTWRNYNGANPHTHHVHISVKPNAASYDSEVAWSVSVSETAPITT